MSYLVSYRSLRAMVLPLLSVVVGTVWTVGFMGMAGYPLSLITIVTPPLILIFGNEYNIYTTSESLRGPARDPPGGLGRATRNVAAPIAMAVLTTVIGFLSLLTTSIHQTREFAVAASVGSLSCAFLALVFLPAMFALLPPAGRDGGRPAPRLRSRHAGVGVLRRAASASSSWGFWRWWWCCSPCRSPA